MTKGREVLWVKRRHVPGVKVKTVKPWTTVHRRQKGKHLSVLLWDKPSGMIAGRRKSCRLEEVQRGVSLLQHRRYLNAAAPCPRLLHDLRGAYVHEVGGCPPGVRWCPPVSAGRSAQCRAECGGVCVCVPC